MNPNDWQKIKDLLPEVLSLDDGSRSSVLDASGLSTVARAEIESLLAVEPAAAGFMSMPAGGVAFDFFPDDDRVLAGKAVGRFRLISELGMGGMGAVYLAERDGGDFEQRVAVKMLRRELNSAGIRRKFDREKAIHARLSHPNIARLLDAGTTDDGVPFIALEYVDGLPIDEYCRTGGLGLTDRLKLFNVVCKTVAFAHRNLVVHRDLKPSNILITSDGEPKLLDFGISQLIDTDSGGANLLTTAPALTPAYASPEQIRGEPLTTATDIYSLGVLLFGLLTGEHPFGAGKRTKESLLQAVTTGEPALASSIPDRAGDDGAVSPGQLKGDLDNIVAKALAPEPERRYATVDEFSADIWRFLDGRPVAARRSTFAYQLSRLYKRQRAAVIAAVLVLASIIGGAGAAIWQAGVARSQAAIAVAEADKAKAEQDRAEQIVKFMVRVISYANPSWYGEGGRYGDRGALVIEAINDLEGQIDSSFEGHADIQAELHHKFAEVFGQQGLKDPEQQRAFAAKFEFHALRALELRRQFYGEHHEEVAKDLYYAHTILAKGDPYQRGAILDQCIHMMRDTNPWNLNLAYFYEEYGALICLPGQEKYHEPFRRALTPATSESSYEIAERFYLEALPIFRHHYTRDNSAIYLNECRLSWVLAMQAKWPAFDEHYPICQRGQAELGRYKFEMDLIDKALAARPHGVQY